MRMLGVLLFPEFELLDAFGPLEIFGHRLLAHHYRVTTVALEPGPVASAQGPRAMADHGFGDCPPLDALLVPGGMGTRREVDDPRIVRWVGLAADASQLVASVCTGAALLARAGVLDERRATTNKRAFDWVVTQGPRVDWVRKARWVEDGKIWTSSGVSAGIDMALAIVAKTVDFATAHELARQIEYRASTNPDDDPFA